MRCAWSGSRGYEGRRSAQVSGGQRQRVALARALVNRPSVLLLDEPLGALDLKLREEMQIELKAIQSEVGITFIYVTHDQEEALTMSNRVAVFNGGRVEQVGTPADIYEHPATTFVAGFVGTSNLLTGAAARSVIGEDGVFTVRPEKIRLADPNAQVADDEASVGGTVREVVYIGPDTRYIVELELGGELVVTQQNLETSSMEALTHGRPVRLVWKRRHVLSLATSQEDGGRGRDRRVRQLRIPSLMAGIALLAAACTGGTAGPTMMQELGDGEGELNLIIWSGYAEEGANYPEFDWVTPFEEATGCQVNTTVQADSAHGAHFAAVGRVRRRVILR